MVKNTALPEIDSVNRRGILRLAAGGIVALPFASSIAACSRAEVPAVETVPPHLRLMSDIADTVIPETDTPGALSAGITEYMSLMLSDWLKPEERAAMIASLTVFDDAAAEQGASDFLGATPEQKAATLNAMEAAGSPVFRELKQVIVFGYCTSEAGADLLNYDPVPGEYRACLPLEEAGPAAMLYGH